MKKHYRHENNCLNCGTILEGHYCHNCGQENLELHESFGHLMNHTISDYFHFDHQFFHTLKPLLFKPGFLTIEYMSGRRAQYLHPVKMYIFISIVYFLLLFQTNGDNNIARINDNGKPAEKGVVVTPASNKPFEQAKKAGEVVLDYTKTPNGWFHPTTKDTSYAEYLTNQKKLAENDRDGFVARVWNKKTFEYREKYGNHAKEVFAEELRHNIPKMMFILLPLFALILKIAFWRNKKFYVEHLIYSFHFHCFLFLFLAFFMLLQLILLPFGKSVIEWLTLPATLYVIWYIYRSLRAVYHRSIFRTITKMIGMWIMYFAALSFCVTLVFVITTII
ncbi:DUF3667 domain-containing protein [Mucilaginibacter sp. BT774]|uniref:DUF3667 domain-containing protein n=1 Tax=Mucilaginibacter sp. BT774 TaxID=3062276 RepID=UPI002676478D|nr:DUF3667 domain-containing protein [Mucilaginibacter sp. BT774]MDO3625121.1 DUF3667 domain-containing protein [Mucilaginibacter sp. BT774]